VRAGLELIPLPDDLRKRIDELVPSRWSRGNPIDLAGGETRDTIPEVLELCAAHPEVDAVIYLGLGIQANQAHAFRSGEFFPRHGLDRIVEFHERQDRRYALAAAEASARHAKPVLIATDLTYTDRHYGNAGPLGVRDSGRIAWPSGQRAVRSLARMLRYARWRALREGA
jgi:acetyltransferase